jgi:hypothetical protein
MSAAKHTPGPWFSDEEHVIRQVTPGQKFQHPIMVANGWIEGAWVGDDGNEESRANARLIAAAPELLEALLEMLPRFVALRELARIDEQSALTIKARAAIEKATGSAQ